MDLRFRFLGLITIKKCPHKLSQWWVVGGVESKDHNNSEQSRADLQEQSLSIIIYYYWHSKFLLADRQSNHLCWLAPVEEKCPELV